MTPEEVSRLLVLAVANFPNLQDKDMEPTAMLWQKMLSDMPYQLAENALVKVLATSKFFPSVAEIREAASQLTQPAQMTAIDAWGEVLKAIRYYGFYREKEAMAFLPPEVANLVRKFGWREICTSEQPEVIRAQFRMAWETQAARQKELAVLPAEIREMIAGVSKMLPEVPQMKRVIPEEKIRLKDAE